MKNKGGGSCIGLLKEALDHITEKANDMCTCHYDSISNKVTSFGENKYDFIVSIYMMGEVLRKRELKIPKFIVDNLPKEEL